MNTTVVIGSDHAGFALKEQLKRFITGMGREVVDVGADTLASCDYPVYAFKLCDLVLEKDCLGILICGSGVGMSMAANRRKGIRAALCANEWLARATRMHNDANVLCLGERWIGAGLAEAITHVFLTTDFEGGRHQRRIDLIDSNL
ncbi:Putative sugar phosphate isomerase YwlF [Fundidesulfovibrio magnetotacticus]|uniref:Sugar phosphate isomerase YwlF n=1 Tax=Fundidesulfovibrio magnetotacticus TaxID=2730080 RepID=A0A6V8LZQ1_9BACT|nr:ribose 5-phosphate isomerase B [Fundidesulfovibrio magnetotacticus]GFK95499.1 Putative sugar phosphate isomerase YwlF [Fundidesulfovibrio magnetotacticus]